MIPNTVGTDSTMEFYVGGSHGSKKTLTITEGEPKVEILESGTANTALKFHKTSAMSSLSLYQQHDTPAKYPGVYFSRSRGTYSTKATVATGDTLEVLTWEGYDASNFVTAGSIGVDVEETVATGEMGSKMWLSTCAASAGGGVTRMTSRY